MVVGWVGEAESVSGAKVHSVSANAGVQAVCHRLTSSHPLTSSPDLTCPWQPPLPWLVPVPVPFLGPADPHGPGRGWVREGEKRWVREGRGRVGESNER